VQERQFPPSPSEQQTPTELEALRRVRARRLTTLAGAIGAATLACLALGCPQAADLENAKSYPLPGYPIGGGTTSGGTAGGTAAAGTAAGGSAAGTATGGTSGGDPCDTACIKDILQVQSTLCALCHNNTTLTSSGLDLKSDGFTARLRNIPAKHTDLPAGMTAADCPVGDKLIDTTTPSASWLLKKIEGQQGQCGTPMPSSGMLTATQKTCMETYIACVAGGAITGGGGAATGGQAAGGTATGGGGNGGAGGK